MRKFTTLFLFLIIAFLASVTGLNAQTALLNESFDNITSGVPTGWDDSDYTCSASTRWKSDASGYNGTRCLRFNTYSATSGSYSALKTPVLNLNQPFTLRFKFKNYNAGTMDVRISTDGGATYTTVLENGLTTPDASTWVEKEYSLAPYVGQSNVRIVWYCTSNYGSQRQYLDDVVVESAPTCKAPTGLYVNNMGTTSADLNWDFTQDGDQPGSLQLTVTDEGGNVVISDNTISGSAYSYSMTGLSPNTTYSVSMRGDCSGTLGGMSKYGTFTFTTACNPTAIPYTEDFDALTGIPDCTTSVNADINTSTKYGTSGKSLRLQATTGDFAYVIFPIVSHASNDIEMTFMAKSSISSALSYKVGIVTDPADIEGTFEPLRIDSMTQNSSWVEIRMNTSLAQTQSQTVAMCIFVDNGKSGSLYIDNVSIHAIPNCVRPEDFRAFNPTATSVDVDWSTSTAANHIIDITDADGNASQVMATSNPYTITGLQPNTQYTLRLRGYCGVGDTSEYASAIVTVKTLCMPLTTTLWFEGAESTTGTNLPDCWIYGWTTRPTSGNTYDQPFVTQSSTYHSGARAFQLKDMASGAISYMTSPGFPVDSANKYQASIWIYRASGSSYAGEGLRLFASNSPDDLTYAQELGFVNRMVGNAPVEADGAGWYQYTFPIAMTGTVYLVIQGESKYGSATNFDDIAVELAPTCTPVGDIALGTLSANNDIDITWTPGAKGETSWVLVYNLKVGSSVVASDSLVVTSPTYTLTNLSAATNYTVNARVYAMCSATDMSAAKKFTGTFTTPCGTITSFPYVQDFEGGTVPPMCWTQQVVATTSSGTSNTWQAYTSQKHTGTYSAYIPDKQVGAKTALTTGVMDFSDPAGYQVSYWQYRPSNSYQSKVDEAMHIFVHPTDSLDETTAVEIGVVNNHYLNDPAEAAAGWYQYTFDVPTSVTGLQHVSFCYHNQYGSGSYIDDIMIRPAPTCRDLAAPVVSDIQPTSAIVSINDTSAHTWDISYGPQGTAAGAGTIVTVTDTMSYTLTGLTANADYDVYVRRNCGTEFGMWTISPVSFTAICTDATATIADVDAYSFTVNANANDWELSYGPQGTSAAAGTIVPVSGTNTYTVTGLTPATQYVAYVRHNCSGVYSNWSSAYSVKTTIVPDSIPFGTGFEDDTDNLQWTIVNGSSSTNVFTFGTDAAGVASGSKALYMSNGGSTYGYDNYSTTKTYAYRTIYFGSGVHNVTFRWKCTGGESTFDFGRVMLVPASEALVGGSGSSYSSTTFPNYLFAFDPEGANKMNVTTGDENGWNTYNADIDMTGHEGTYNFVVMWNNDGSVGDQLPLSIDNVSISQVSCNRPATLSSATTANGTTISVATQTATEWEIAVSDTAIDIFGTVTGNIYQQVTNAPAVLTGLTSNTLYYYTARAICGVGDTSQWAEVQTVRTACDAYAVPYNETFEDMGALNCWSSFGNQAVTRNTSYKYAGGASMKVADATAVSPTLNVTTLASYMLNGWAYSTTDSTVFNVGVMVDPSDVSTFEVLGTVTVGAKNTWTEFTTYFNLLNDPDYADFYNAQHFAIAVGSDFTVYVDDLYLGPIPTCPKPTEVAITNVLAHTFDMAWTENGTATSWRIQAVPDVAGQPAVDTVVSTNPASIVGLGAASGYSIKIQAICSAADTSLVTNCGHIKTTCDIVNVPYEETFEFMTAQTIPDCWDNSASTTSTASGSNAWYVWGVYETGGNKMIRMYNYYVQNGLATIKSPVISLNTTNACTLAYDYCNQSSSGNLNVFISNNGGSSWDTVGVHSGSSGSYSAPGSWTTAQVSLAAYQGQNVVLRFSNTANFGSGAIFVDNVNITEDRSCATPQNLAVVGTPTSHEAQISWTPGSTETEWIVRIIGAGGTTYQTATASPYTVTGLNAASNYAFSVCAICGVGDTSNFTGAVSAATACDVVNAPYSENFESMTAGAVPNCWDNSDSETSTVTSNPSYVWGVYNTAGSNVIRMYNGYVQTGSAVINSPSINLTGAAIGYEMKFDYCHQASCGEFTLEISNNNGVSWTELGSYSGATGSSVTPGSWTTASVNLGAYNGDTIIFRFYADANYGSGAIFIDNINFKQLRSCSDITSLNTNATDSSVVVNINDTAATHTQWQYMFGPAGFDTTGVAPVLIDTNVFTITGLTSKVTYDVYVRAYCDAVEQSNWTFKSVQTTGVAAALPYVCHFTDAAENAQWTFVTNSAATGTNTFTIGTDANALDAGETAALYVSNNGSSYTYTISGGASSSAAYRLFHFDASQYHLSFNWKCTGGESNYDYARFYLVPAVEPIYLPSAGSYSSSGWPSDMIALDGGGKRNLVTSPVWNNVDATLDMTARAGSYFLVFVWSNDGSAGTANYPLAVNDIEISELTCFAPANITIPDSTITETTAVVHYDQIGTAGTPVRYWVNTTGSRTDTLMTGVVTASPISFTGLSGSSTYYIFMKSECSATDESPVASAMFSTACGIISSFPYTEGFEGDQFAPNCWTATGGDASWMQYTPSYTPSNYIHSGSHSAYVYGDYYSSAYLATPQIQFDSLREFYVSFWVYLSTSSYYTDYVQVYLSDNANSTTGATLLGRVDIGDNATTGMAQFTFDVPMYTSGAKYIIFEGFYDYAVYIDDILIDRYPTCRDLSSAPTVASTTGTTMTVSVNKGPNHQGVIFAYAPASATSVADTIGSVYSTTGSAVITGLTNSTTYQVYARGVCSESDSTAWTAAVTGTTQASDCFEPQNLRLVGLAGSTTATITWGGAPDASSYVVNVVGTQVYDSVTTDTVALAGLASNAAISVRVRTLCPTDTSAWVTLSFNTTPEPAVLPYRCDFEDVSEVSQWNFLNDNQTNTFMIGSATSNGGASSLYITNDGDANAYTNTSSSVSFATRFFQLQPGQYAYSYDWAATGESGYDYGRVWLVTSDQVLTPGTLPTSISGAVLDGNTALCMGDGWTTRTGVITVNQAVNVNLVFVWRNDGSAGTNPPVAFDNIEFRMLTCPQPTVSVINASITENSASVVVANPNESDTLVYAVSLGSVEDAFLVDTSYNDTINLTNLPGSSSINVYVKVLCSETDESFWTLASFRTLCGQASLPYTESFEELPTSYSGPGMIETICWNDLNAAASTSSYPYYKASTTYYSEGSKSLQFISSTSVNLYAILPSFGDINNCRVTFDARYENLTASGTISVGYLTDITSEASFVNAFTATAAAASQMDSYVADIANIPAGARLAFKYSTGGTSNYWAWLDNIRVSQLVAGPTYTDTVCFGEPFVNYGFNVPDASVLVGDNTFTRLKAGVAGAPDTMITANVYKYAKVEAITYDTLCQGQPLVWGGVTIQNPTSRAYTQTGFVSVLTGCDSTVTLLLTVVPTTHNISDTICRGDAYQFGTQTLTETGLYTNIETSRYGCQDTTYLALFVVETQDTTRHTICSGDSYQWHGQVYRTAGTYTWTGTGSHGCSRNEVLILNVTQNDSTIITSFCKGGSVLVVDTVINIAGTYTFTRYDHQIGCNVTYHATVTEDPIRTGYAADYACQDHLYYGYGLSGVVITKDTSFTMNTKTWDGLCDSATVVNIKYTATVYAPTDEVSIDEGDVYTWHENTYWESGTYHDTLQAKATGCDSVCTLRLTVGGVEPPTGVDNVEMLNISLVPNPVNAGQTSFVYGNFTNVKSVEVLNSFGQVIDTFVPETYPIEVQGINASGIYYVRVVTEDEKVAVQKLIVK